MSRISFYMFKETSTGQMVLDRDVDVTQLGFFRDGILAGNKVPFPQVVNNGDGTYYFTPSGSGQYSIELNNTKQDEFYNIYIPDSDNLTETRVDGTSITTIGGNLALWSGSSAIFTSSLVDNLTSTADSASLTANQGYVLNGFIAGKLNANDTFLKESYLVQNFASASASRQVQSAESLQIDFSDTNYLIGETSYVSALRKLDISFNDEISGSSYSQFYFYGYSGSMTIDNDTNFYYPVAVGSCSYDDGGGAYYITDTGVVTNVTLQYTVVSASANNEMLVYVTRGTINGASVSSGHIINLSGSALGVRGDTIPLNFNMTAGKYMSTEFEFDSTGLTICKDFAIIVEVTK